jgi:DNA-binding beta-propeller fold protein YncE
MQTRTEKSHRGKGDGVRGKGGYPGHRWTTSGLCAVILLVLLLLAPAVQADTQIGSIGEGAGQYTVPSGIAVDSSTGNLYVADRSRFLNSNGETEGNSRVDVFDSGGNFLRAFGWGVADGSPELQTCTAACLPGIPGNGPGQFDTPVGIDIDPATESVYVLDDKDTLKVNTRRVLKFDLDGNFLLTFGAAGTGQGQISKEPKITVGPDGAVYIADLIPGSPNTYRVQRFSPSGVFEKKWEFNLSSGIVAIAADAAGNIYLANGGETGAVRKYDQSGTLLWSVGGPSYNIRSIAIDDGGNLFVADNTAPASGIYEYDSAGTPIRGIFGSVDAVFDLAVTASGIYAAPIFREPIVFIPYPALGPVVVPGSTKATGIRSSRATFEAAIGPQGKATTYHFEYVDQASFEASGFSGPNVKSSPEQPVPLANPGDPEELIKAHRVELEVQGLLPETTYHFRVVAEDSENQVTEGPEGVPFSTLDPLEIGASWVTEVGTDSAAMHAEVNPLGTPATGYFEYVDQATFEVSGFDEATQLPAVGGGAAPLDFGAGEEPKAMAALAYPLLPHTTYRYRLIAANHCKVDPEVVCTFTGPERAFTTFAIQGSGGQACPNESLRTGPAAALPDCRGYEMVSPVDKNGSSIEPLANISGFVAGLDQAADNGDSITFSSYRAFGGVESAPFINQFLTRRTSSGWVTEGISPPREGPSLMTYLSASLDRQYKYFSPDLCSGWVVQDADPALAPEAIPGYPGLYRRGNCGAGAGAYEALSTIESPLAPTQVPRRFIPELQGVSDDGSAAIFLVTDNLTADSPAQPKLCVTQDIQADPCNSHLYEARDGQVRFVCVLPNGSPDPGDCSAGDSDTGGRSSNLTNAISADGSRIFWSAGKSGPAKLYVRIEGLETVLVGSGEAEFEAAAADGSKAIYSIGSKLFEFDVETRTTKQIAAGYLGLAGASDDADKIYLASTEDLASGATKGSRNLYLYEAGSGFTYIADLPDETVATAIANNPRGRISRVTPDGEHLVFMSVGSPTGYDNSDAETGEPDYEVFLYDATAEGGAGKLLCVSCNPSGARPKGKQMTQKLFDLGPRAAARITTWTSDLHASRVITDDGDRLFFDSFEALVPRDTNGAEDVYQWQAPGSSACTEASSDYQPPAGGCVYLISTGKNPKGSELVDLSVDGDDVFFKTYAALDPRDDGALDIYDARVNGGTLPLPSPPAACEGEACQPPLAPPNDPTPASSTFEGKGNVRAEQPGKPRCPKGKRLIRRNGKPRCVKAHRKHGGKKSAGKKRNSDRRTTR